MQSYADQSFSFFLANTFVIIPINGSHIVIVSPTHHTSIKLMIAHGVSAQRRKDDALLMFMSFFPGF